MEGFEKNDERELESKFREEIYSKAIRAGKRTYFFDVKSTRNDEYYLTITESKKRFEQDGQFHFEKHKIFLYKEDFEKFMDGLQEVIDFISENQLYDDDANSDFVLEVGMDEEETDIETVSKKDYTNIDFDDLSH
ncbi:MAG: DNA-binding protein [Bacteroidetes bacterium GWF2_42_66]|nr:MAG: DNA-binding protein [Bacteroidetes bacterium GWA2_42_15]OFY01150.1 MAG: DNA-binding protein [Bacteroidetes bacterium GWE2_42_39]OFY41993.1 MAG: DNA-binding protein [Bacteroidetes bacterium GWF2_42_66]HBL77808.1 DNA-binding protein [Prolixibacteraceae bacterium]HCU63289.1 DNA-binding protein [Prolixibacteraceae bacterium]